MSHPNLFIKSLADSTISEIYHEFWYGTIEVGVVYFAKVSEINIGNPTRAIIKPRGEVSRSRIIVLMRFSIHIVRKQNINILLAFAM